MWEELGPKWPGNWYYPLISIVFRLFFDGFGSISRRWDDWLRGPVRARANPQHNVLSRGAPLILVFPETFPDFP